ncbi:DUF4167 domain-containing protein [Neorhizobium sp. NCHU2750]|uniref:DUF4167 domain-containing protein n=1 Tax=Neorhizobium sp. NCHU2750 TaxID=1825976 RepID=UPI000E76E36D
MRPGQQNKRGRGRGSNNNGGGGGGNNNFQRKGGNPLSRTYDSSGPDVKIRGTAQHIAEKYSALARDAQSSGDRVMAENYLQHAEHYNRIIAAAQAQMQDRFQHQERDGNSIDQDDLDGGDGDDLGYAPQPMIDEPQQRREQREQREPREQNAQGQNPQGQNGQGQNNQAQGGQEQQPRENRRDRNERRERRQDRPDRGERAERSAEPKAPVAPQVTEAAEISAPVIEDGSGPQPVIEGTPAEVVVEEEAQTEAAPRRRRAAATRPRRQPRKSAEAAEGEEPATEMADVAAGE